MVSKSGKLAVAKGLESKCGLKWTVEALEVAIHKFIRMPLMKREYISLVKQPACWDHILGSIPRPSIFSQQSR
jgi:hypothetical protein